MTYYTYAKTKMLNVDNTFAHLVAMNDDTLTFEFTYSVSQVDVVVNNALAVIVYVYTQSVTPSSIQSITNTRNAQQVVSSLQSYVSDVKKSINEQKQYIIATKRSDISAYVNNSVLSEINSGFSKNDIFLLRKTKLALAQDTSLPTITFPQDSEKYTTNDAMTFMKNLILDGIDPTKVLDLTDLSISAHDSIAGTSKNVKIDELMTLKKLQDFYLYSDTQQKSVNYALVNAPDDTIEVSMYVAVPRNKISSSKLYVRFDLINSTTMCIDTITRDFDVTKHMQIFSMPVISPTVLFKRSTSGESQLEIRQNDEKAKSIKLYKKVISTVSADSNNGYSFYNEYKLKKAETIKVPVSECVNSFAVYRAISTGEQNNISDTFTNVVVSPRFYVNEKNVVINTLQIENGIKVCISNIPNRVVSVEIVVRNLSYHEVTYKNVDKQVHYVSKLMSVAKAGIVNIDKNVNKGNVYEYAAKLTYSTGEWVITGSCIVEYIKSETNKIFTNIQNVKIDSTNVDVSFDISTKISDTDNTNVKTLLEAAGITQYDDMLITTRDALSVLIAHNVQRVDLTSGVRSDFGIITGNNFIDSAFAINNSIEKLQSTHSYRYEVMPLLRSSDTLFYDLLKSAVDVETKKSFNYSPAKYLNPLSLDNGTLYSSDGIKQLNAKDQMSYGAIGNVITTNVVFNEIVSISTSITLERTDRYTNVINWKAANELSTIDHFMIILNNMNVKTIVGRVHSQSENCQFTHTLTKQNIGALQYEIVPVFNDYSLGSFVNTDTIFIEDI